MTIFVICVGSSLLSKTTDVTLEFQEVLICYIFSEDLSMSSSCFSILAKAKIDD